MFIIMGGLAFIAVEIVGVLFILLQIIVVESECTCCFGGGGYQPLNVRESIAPGSVADLGGGQSRFDSIRPRIQFAPKYKPISEA